MSSYLFYDINKKNEVYAPLIQQMEEYATLSESDIFMLRLPKNDLSDPPKAQNGCFMVMSAHHKVALVNAFATDDAFKNYQDDVNDVISYLAMKYEYRAKLGRLNKWAEVLIEPKTIHDFQDLDVFWESLKLESPQQKKYADLLVALCTGSINDINRVKADVPTNILDQIKQKIQLFDADQTRFIYQETPKGSTKKTIKIQGLSGTGKTELLLHKLKQLYTTDDNSRIFVTCHNKILASSLHDRIPEFFNFMKVEKQILWEKRLWCTNAWGRLSDENSGLYRYLCKFYGIPYQSYTRLVNFDTVCKNAVEQIKEQKKSDGFKFALDYVLVDECQDFKPSFIELCKLVTSKRVFLAGDLFQSIFAEYTDKDYEADFFLSKCYRTDPRTLMFAQALGLGLFERVKLRWLKQTDWEACGYTYNEVNGNIVLRREPVRRFLDIDDNYDSIQVLTCQPDKMSDGIIRIIKKIREEYPSVTEDDICIILLDSDDYIYNLANVLEVKILKSIGWDVNKAYETKNRIAGSLLISNRNNVKGLEYPFVICMTMKLVEDYAYRNAVYTMLSRSFIKSYMLVSSENNGITDPIKEGLKEIKENRQMTIKIPSDAEQKIIATQFKRAVERKPLAEIIEDILDEMKVPSAQKKKVIDFGVSLGWENFSDEELKVKLKQLLAVM